MRDPEARPPTHDGPDRTDHRPPGSVAPAPVRVVPWIDPLVDRDGIDPGAEYVIECWLPILGPSATLLLRHLADGLVAAPSGYVLDLAEAARALGLGVPNGRQSPFLRSVGRLERYGMVRRTDRRILTVRRRVSLLSSRQLLRLPAAARERHRQWSEATDLAPRAVTIDRARLLALDLAVLGDGVGDVERHLVRWGAHPAIAYAAALWAREHRSGGVLARSPAGAAPDDTAADRSAP